VSATAAPSAPWPYDAWGRITRFLESGRLAFAREHELWSTLEIDQADEVVISVRKPQGLYKVRLQQHLDAIKDEQTFHAAVLVQSYALVESAAAERLDVDARTFNGIEHWGHELLTHAATDWSAVKGGQAGAVTTAVVRNAVAHGERTISARAAKRLSAAGIRGVPKGTPISLTYDELTEHRARLLSLLRCSQVER